MNILIFLVCILFIMITFFIDRRIYNPLILFNLWWGITVFISGFGFYNVFVPQNETYFVILIGILSFNASFILYFLFSFNRLGYSSYRKVKHKEIYNKNLSKINKILLFLHLLISVELFRRSFIVLQLLNSGMPYSRIRYAFFYEDQIMPGYTALINNWVVSPVVTFSIILVALNIGNKNFDRKLVLSTFILAGLTAFSSGGRGILITILLAFILSFIISGKKIQINISNKFKVINIILLITVTLILITGARTNDENIILKSLEQIIIYYTSPYIYFEVLSEYTMDNKPFLFGLTFFGGIWDVFILLLRAIGMEIDTISSYISEYNQTYLQIGNGKSFNALPTMLYTFIYDLGVFGAIIGPFMFGILSMYIYYKLIIKNNIMYKGMYIMICLMIYGSVMKWDGIYTGTWCVFLLFIIYNYFSKKLF